MEHFSHKHKLKVVNEITRKDVVCYGCQESISGSAYTCIKGCNYFLHEKCAKLSEQITHPMHDHPLTLLAHPHSRTNTCICSVCHKDEWKWFTYNCPKGCEFNIDVLCIFREQSVVPYQIHKLKDHKLTFVQRPALLTCDACGTRSEDFSYRCTTCPFWVHQLCASSPPKIKLSDHQHNLVLAYSLPYTRRGTPHSCNICHGKVDSLKWVYYCDKFCNYYAHLKCADPFRGDKYEIKAEEDRPNCTRFPVPDDSVNLVSQHSGDIQRSHPHPLILFDVQSNEETEYDEIIICDGCVRPIIISVPYFGCEICGFFLHKSCDELPPNLQHPCHKHPLSLKMTYEVFSSFWCRSCKILCNGLAFCCEDCNFYLDVKCASCFLPDTIKHEGHEEHPLVRFEPKMLTPGDQCIGCGKEMQIFPTFMFGCDNCNCKYFLDDYCAMLPQRIWHKWDHHALTLVYPPFSNDPDEFCEICEEGINTNYWFYHCRPCKQSFHTQCVRPFDTYSNIKFGGSFKVEYHPHDLLFVRQSEFNSPLQCGRCRGCVDGVPVLQCSSCNFLVCLNCAELRSKRACLEPLNSDDYNE